MAFPIKDCNCEDFPCCIHADNFPTEPEYCDICGYYFHGNYCKGCYPDDEDEDTDE